MNSDAVVLHEQTQPRQYEADQRDGVCRLIETHLKDQPRSTLEDMVT
jgi:hypothetical protein